AQDVDARLPGGSPARFIVRFPLPGDETEPARFPAKSGPVLPPELDVDEDTEALMVVGVLDVALVLALGAGSALVEVHEGKPLLGVGGEVSAPPAGHGPIAVATGEHEDELALELLQRGPASPLGPFEQRG